MNIELTILFDYYGELLTNRQRQYFMDYYFDNLSLQEIAENVGVSRNAVFNSLKEIEKKLNYYEEKLKLYEKSKEINKIIENIDEKLKNKIKELI